MQIGNGGLAGTLSIMYSSAQSMLQRGYAVAGTDDGHKASDPPGWPVGHPEKVKDLAWRSVHETSVVAKKLVPAFYERGIDYSYFQGCSTGGKEAFMEAQRFPEDFDGILAGAPAMRYTDLIVRFIWDMRALLDNPANNIPASKLPAIQNAALKQCDAKDGVSDGVIGDPRQCRFDPAVLRCTAGESDSCLTDPQISALKKIYAGPTNPRTGSQIIFGYEPGGESSPGTQTWTAYIAGATGTTTSAQYTVSNLFNKYLVYENADWDYRTFDFDRDVAFMHQKLDPVPFDATSRDLSDFQKKKGKLIHYHGWNDYSVAPRESIDYYEGVITEQMRGRGHHDGDRRSGLERTQDFYRLFMVPGMDHCAGGSGPNAFGQLLSYNRIANTPPPSNDAQHDVVTALERWVEKGIEPERIVATKYLNDDPAKGVKTQRPLCPYPKVAVYKGRGSTDAASSFRCRLPRDRTGPGGDHYEHDDRDDRDGD
jgi:feruloyl esterase